MRGERPFCYSSWRVGGVAQLGERRVRNAKVGSSILLLSTNRFGLRGKPLGLLSFKGLVPFVFPESFPEGLLSTGPMG